MKGFDAFAGVIKSGGKTRRAAKMVILNIDHPDIVEFIECKAKEEKKAWTLMEAGYDGSVDGEAYGSIFFQNANNSVRVTDEFMKAGGTGWDLGNPGTAERGNYRYLPGAGADAKDRRVVPYLRRSGDAVRYDDQPLAHLQKHGAHQCFESLFRIYVPG